MTEKKTKISVTYILRLKNLLSPLSPCGPAGPGGPGGHGLHGGRVSCSHIL